MFDKNNKRSLRRWKTKCKHTQRARMLSNNSWYDLTTLNDKINRIKSEQYTLLETPCDCSCPHCSSKNSWSHRKHIREMRNEGKNMVDYFFRVEYTVEDDGAGSLIG